MFIVHSVCMGCLSSFPKLVCYTHVFPCTCMHTQRDQMASVYMPTSLFDVFEQWLQSRYEVWAVASSLHSRREITWTMQMYAHVHVHVYVQCIYTYTYMYMCLCFDLYERDLNSANWAALVAHLVELQPRMLKVVGSSPTQGNRLLPWFVCLFSCLSHVCICHVSALHVLHVHNTYCIQHISHTHVAHSCRVIWGCCRHSLETCVLQTWVGTWWSLRGSQLPGSQCCQPAPAVELRVDHMTISWHHGMWSTSGHTFTSIARSVYLLWTPPPENYRF